MRIVDEHYGFNIVLIIGYWTFENYVERGNRADIEKREGLWEFQALGKSFSAVFQTLIDSMNKEAKEAKRIRLYYLEPALPVVWNPTCTKTHDRHLINSIPDIALQCRSIRLTNQVGKQEAMDFSMRQYAMIKNGWVDFWPYEIDQTNRNPPPQVNAYFQRHFIHLWTNCNSPTWLRWFVGCRPMKFLCRVGGKVPDSMCWTIFYLISHNSTLGGIEEAIKPLMMSKMTLLISIMKQRALNLKYSMRATCGYHMAFY